MTKIFEVIQHDTDRRMVPNQTVAVKDSKQDAEKVAETLESLTGKSHTVREREV